MIGGSGERKTLRLVAQYADACNIVGDVGVVAHKVDVLRRHCETLGRDPSEIEVTAMVPNLPPGASTADLVAAARSMADVGVSTLVAPSAGPDPAAWLEATFGPAMEELAGIEAVRR